MGLPNGVHHLAIATRDVKVQLDFFTDVIGMELVALYWMHGVDNTVHAFVKMGDTASIAPGVMQHLALNVDSETDLLAMRDRIRSRGHWVMGPVDHGFCKSIYLVAPEGIMLEFSTWTGLDTDEWVDPEVVARCGLSAADVARYRNPPAFVSQGGKVPQPDPNAEPNLRFVFPLEWRQRGEALYRMSDEELSALFSDTTPPNPKRKAAVGD